jgi:putative hydrolase of the HAD superfamily
LFWLSWFAAVPISPLKLYLKEIALWSQKPMSRAIELIVFDMGHVFVDFEWDVVCQAFRERSGLSSEAFKEVLRQITTWGYETGHLNTVDLLKRFNEVLAGHHQGRDGAPGLLREDEFHELWNLTFRENDIMAEILSSLKERFPLYLLSNTNESHWNYLTCKYNVGRHFQELILSHEVQMAKPDPRIYELVLEKAGVAAQRCVFIDDLAVNVQAASGLGIQTIQFQGPEHLIAALAELGVIL